MTITPTALTRAAGVAAALAGLLFIGIQVDHPAMTVSSVTTTDWAVRNALKLLMAVLSLIGITGMYLHHVKKMGALGVLGFVVFAANYLLMVGIEFVAAFVLPAIATSAPGYVGDVLAVAFQGTPSGDVGLIGTAIAVVGITYLVGGVVFGIALVRANVLSRWAAALLTVGTLATIAIPLLPHVNERLFAIPTGVALIGLGYSLWRVQRSNAAPVAVSPPLDPAGAR